MSKIIETLTELRTTYSKDKTSGWHAKTEFISQDGKTGWYITTTKGNNKKLYTYCNEGDIETRIGQDGKVFISSFAYVLFGSSRHKDIQQETSVMVVNQKKIQQYHEQGLAKFRELTSEDFIKKMAS
jgi:hypothetical protein